MRLFYCLGSTPSALRKSRGAESAEGFGKRLLRHAVEEKGGRDFEPKQCQKFIRENGLLRFKIPTSFFL